MKKSILISLGLGVLMLLFASCGGGYNTDYSPPGDNSSKEDVFPAEIGGLEADIKVLQKASDAIAIQSKYNDKITISVIRFDSKEKADTYFKEQIVSEFDGMSSRSSGQINGKWFAKGSKGKAKAYAWANNNWIFSISAENKDYFEKAIDEFKYISK